MIGLVSGLSLAHPGVQAPRKTSTELDVLLNQGAVLLRAYSVRQLRTSYPGQCCRLRGNGTGSPEADIPFTSGALDKSAVATLKANGGGSATFWTKFYDQAGNADATQSTAANQVRYGESVFSTGAMGDSTAQTNTWMDFPMGTLSAPFSVWVVCNCGGTGSLRMLVGVSNSSSIGLSYGASRIVSENWGATLTGVITSLKRNIIGVCNGASSSIYIGGTQMATGNSGSGNTYATMRIGAGSAPSSANFFGTGMNAITEVIVFGSDPTKLAGWSAFTAAAKSYFGTA